MELDYTEKVKEHFFHPKNVGEIKNADGIGKVGNPTCGDVMAIYIKVKDDRIVDIKFKTFGCVPHHEEVVLKDGSWEKYLTTVTRMSGGPIKIFYEGDNYILVREKE